MKYSWWWCGGAYWPGGHVGPGTTGHWNVSIALGRSFTPASYLLPAAAADTFTGDDNM